MAALVDITDSVAYDVHRISRLLRKHFVELASRSGVDLTPEQWFCLNKLRLRGPQNQVELTEAIFSDRPNVTRILAGLEQKGFVDRAPDPEDGRRMIVTLTRSGTKAHDTFARAVTGTRRRLFGGLEPNEVATTRRVLAQLEAAILEDLEQE